MGDRGSEGRVEVLGASVVVGSSMSGLGLARVLGGFRLKLTVLGLPDRSRRRYTAHALPENKTLYLSVLEGVADFFVADPRDKSGYGGATFSGTLESGEPFSCVGPWSGSARAVSSLGVCEPLYPASVVDLSRRGSLLGVSGVTGDVVRDAMRFLPHWSFTGWGQRSGPRISQLSDEQERVALDISDEYIRLDSGLEVCPVCFGAGRVGAEPHSEGSWRSYLADDYGAWFRACGECARGVCSGYKKVPNVDL